MGKNTATRPSRPGGYATKRTGRARVWAALGGAALVAGLIWLALPRPGAALATVRPTGRVGPAVGDTAPVLRVSDIQGQTVSFAGKPTVLYFMASWCSSCTYGQSQLRTVHQHLGDRVNLVTVDVDPQQDTAAALVAFNRQWGGNWPQVLDTGQRLVAAYGIRSLDTTVLLNAQGTIVSVGGPQPAGTLVGALQRLLRA